MYFITYLHWQNSQTDLHDKKVILIPREESFELDCFAWTGATALAVLRDEGGIDRTEPGGD